MITRGRIFDSVLLVVCTHYGVTPEQMTKQGRAGYTVAWAKKAICYFNPIYIKVHYRYLMGRLCYGEKTQSRHTRNRKEVLKRMNNDPAYKQDIKKLSKAIELCIAALLNEYLNEIREILTSVDIDFAIVSKDGNIKCSQINAIGISNTFTSIYMPIINTKYEGV